MTIDSRDGSALTFEPEDDAAAIAQALRIILRTPMGECPLYRECGVDQSYLHLPGETAKVMHSSAVLDAVSRLYGDTVQIDEIRYESDPDAPDVLYAIMEVTINEQNN